jgi:hypothetical protein
VQPTLIIQELQSIKYIKATHPLSSLDSLSYKHDDCHKQVVLIPKSRDDLNRRTPYRGKPDQHATRFPHLVHIWPSTIQISHGPRIATFREVVNSDGQNHCSQEKGLLTQSLARRLIDPQFCTQFLSLRRPLKQWG